jgi:predicted enzyme related to lactoylglutathione lyase
MSGEGVNAVVDTAIIFTENMEALAEFYRQGLELGKPNRAPGHIGFQLPGLYLGFDQVQDLALNHPGGTTLWFRVDDVDATFERLVGLGAAVRYAPALKPMGDYLAAVFDPDGNLVGLSLRK